MSFWMTRYRKLSGSKLSRRTRIRFMRWVLDYFGVELCVRCLVFFLYALFDGGHQGVEETVLVQQLQSA
jgi:hypothetical protein